MSHSYKLAIKAAGKVIDAWLPHKILYDQTPGLSVGIVHKGKLVYKRGFGFTDMEQKKPATQDTAYRIASISKTFTAVAIMQLVEQNKLQLDDKVQSHLPWFKTKTETGDLANVTIRQLLSHTSGIFRDGDTLHWSEDNFPQINELKKSISEAIIFENGTRFKYSNFGYAILGEIIKKASGLHYNDYVKKHIIEKIGMSKTAPDLTKENETWLAKGYTRVIPNFPRTVCKNVKTNSYASATGFVSTVSDLAAFVSALSLSNDTLLSRESKKELMREQIATGEENMSYGLGLLMYDIANRKIIGHSGGFSGFITHISFDTKNEIGVIVLSNSTESCTAQIQYGILKMIYTFIDESQTYLTPQKNKRVSLYEGAYRSKWNDDIVVEIGKNLFTFDPKYNSPTECGTLLKPQAKHSFVMESNHNFAAPGELATFLFEHDKKHASKVIFATDVSTRI